MKPAFCTIVKISQEGAPDGPNKVVVLNFGDLYKASLDTDKANFNQRKQELAAATVKATALMAKGGLKLEAFVNGIDLLKVWYVPIFEKKEQATNTVEAAKRIAGEVLDGKMDAVIIKGSLKAKDICDYYKKALSTFKSEDGAVAGNAPAKFSDCFFNRSDPRVFDSAKDEPRVEFLPSTDQEEAEYKKRFGWGKETETSLVGFAKAGVIGWRKIFTVSAEAGDAEPDSPNVSDFIYMTDEGNSNLNVKSKQRCLGVIIAETEPVPVPAVIAGVMPGALVGGQPQRRVEFAWAKVMRLKQNRVNVTQFNRDDYEEDPNHAILKIKSELADASDSTSLKWLIPAALGAVSAGAIAYGLSQIRIKNNKNGGNKKANKLAVEYYVMNDQKFASYKPGTHAQWSKDGKDGAETFQTWKDTYWTAWDSNATTGGKVSYAAVSESDVKVGAAPNYSASYESDSVRIEHDGRWMALPAPPEYTAKKDSSSKSYADSYFGRFDFSNNTFSPVSLGSEAKSMDASALLDTGTVSTLNALTDETWQTNIQQAGKVSLVFPNAEEIEVDKSPDTTLRLYATYTLKYFIAYYVYDFLFKKMYQVAGFWRTYGDKFPSIEEGASPAKDSFASGTTEYKYTGKWCVFDTAQSDADNVTEHQNNSSKTAVERLSSSEILSKYPTVTGAKFVYAAYAQVGHQTIVFKWFVYKEGESSDTTSKAGWKEYCASRAYDWDSAGIQVDADGTFITKYKADCKGDSDLYNKLGVERYGNDYRYVYAKKWYLPGSDGDPEDSGILVSGKGRLESETLESNKGKLINVGDFLDKNINTSSLSDKVVYKFYAVYDETPSYDIKFYVLSNNDNGEEKWVEVGESDIPENANWSGLVTDSNVTEVSVIAPSSSAVPQVTLSSGDFEFAGFWRVRKGDDSVIGSDLFEAARILRENKDSIENVISDDLFGDQTGVVDEATAKALIAVIGIGASEGASPTLKVKVKSASRVVYRLYAVYDKLYTVRFNLIGASAMPEAATDPVKWENVFEAVIKDGDSISASLLSKEDKITLGDAIAEIALDSYMLCPIWDFEAGTNQKYRFTKLWINGVPSTMNTMIGAQDCFVNDISDLSSLWSFVSKKDDGEGDDQSDDQGSESDSESGTVFHSNDNTFAKEGSAICFYGVYEKNAKAYRVEFYVPAMNEGSLEWISIFVKSGNVELTTKSVENIQFPDMATHISKSLTVSGQSAACTYEFSGYWSVNSNNGWSSSSSYRTADEDNKPGRKELTKDTPALCSIDGDSLSSGNIKSVSLDYDGNEVVYRLYAVYDRVYEAVFHMVSSENAAGSDTSAPVVWNEFFTARIKEGDMMAMSSLKNASGQLLNDALSTSPSNYTVVWGSNSLSYRFAGCWYNPSSGVADSANPLKFQGADDYCFLDSNDDEHAASSWTLADAYDESADVANYLKKAKPAEAFEPYNEDCPFVIGDDGKIRFYAVYIGQPACSAVFYVVSDFAQEEFTWAPYQFQYSWEASPCTVHSLDDGRKVTDPNSIEGYAIADLENDKVRGNDSEKILGIDSDRSSRPNRLVFKGWREVAESEMDQEQLKSYIVDPLLAFNVNAGSRTDETLLYHCACQKEAVGNRVRHGDGVFHEGGSISGVEASQSRINKPFIFIAVYEYQQSFISLSPEPAHSNLVHNYTGDVVFDFDEMRSGESMNTLYGGSMLLSAGSEWNFSVTRNRLKYIPRLGHLNTIETVRWSTDANSGRNLSLISENEDFSDGKSLFAEFTLEGMVWWLTNPSGYSMPVSLLICSDRKRAIGTYTPPANQTAYATYK